MHKWTKEFKRKYQREWYKSHKKKSLKWMNDYYQRHKDNILEYKKVWYRRHKDQTSQSSFISRLRRTYGLTVEKYNTMVLKQKGKCLICKRVSKDTLHIDHCHITKIVRGLLCRSCNNGLGLFKDDPIRLRTAINYLKGVRNAK